MLHIVCIMSIALSSTLAPYKDGDPSAVKIPKEKIKDFRGHGDTSYKLRLKGGTLVLLPVDSCVITKINK